MTHIIFEIKKASELTNPKTKTTASGITKYFELNSFPYYFHAYNPENSFIAVPPNWLLQLAEKAHEYDLVTELKGKIEQTKKEKGKIIQRLQKGYHAKTIII